MANKSDDDDDGGGGGDTRDDNKNILKRTAMRLNHRRWRSAGDWYCMDELRERLGVQMAFENTSVWDKSGVAGKWSILDSTSQVTSRSFTKLMNDVQSGRS